MTEPAGWDEYERLDWLPPHKCGLYLEHNAHRDVYESVTDYYDPDDWVTPEERQRGIDTDEAWTLQWYPHTPIGFHKIVAAALPVLIDAARRAQEAQHG